MKKDLFGFVNQTGLLVSASDVVVKGDRGKKPPLTLGRFTR
ncbi:hypothetical protein [Algoriphagus sp. A40]|nr:hypothetical protein [Algoriphagus sp. A40]